MNIFVSGISHKTAPIDIREKFYLNETERKLLLSTLRSDPAVVEAIVLSTCNRTEIYANVLSEHASAILLKALFKIKNIPFTSSLEKYFYELYEEDAIRHFLRVCAGLESIVFGERQVLGQVKSAVELSRMRGMLGKYFNVLSGLAIRTGKKAQNESQISYGGVSISWAAVTMAKRMLGSFRNKSFLIIGAGKMGHLAAGHLKNRGAGHIYVMNRSKEKAELLAEKFGGTPVSFWDIKEILSEVDVCFCSAGAPHYLIEKDLLEKVMSTRQERKLLCVDISIPRNIEPSVSSLNNVSLITIDDLGDVVAQNMEKRYSALSQVENIIQGKIEQFKSKVSRIQACEQSGSYVSVIV